MMYEIKTGDVWKDEHGEFRVMAHVERYLMCRRKGAYPFILRDSDLASPTYELVRRGK